MSFWGKLVGGTAGFALGGPIGALLGLAAGHGVDKVRKSEQSRFIETNNLGEVQKQLVFATGVIALSAKVAKADGQVTSNEIESFKQVFQFPAEDKKSIGLIFNKAKATSDGYESYARQLYNVFLHQPKILEEIINALFAIALSDNFLHEEEEKILKSISQIFNIDEQTFRSIKASNRKGSNQNISSDDELIEAYAVLGLEADATEEELKKTYKKLVKDYHPDRLVSFGLPKDFVDLANTRISKINVAYDDIKKKKNLY